MWRIAARNLKLKIFVIYFYTNKYQKQIRDSNDSILMSETKYLMNKY